MKNKAYRSEVREVGIHLFAISLLLCLISTVNGQEVFPGGKAGSYNLTEPTGDPINYGQIGFGNELFARKGATYPGPFQTHNWWNSAFWNVQYGRQTGGDMVNSKPMYPLPLMMNVYEKGMQFGYRTIEQQSEDLTVHTSGGNARITSVGGKAYDMNMGLDGNPSSTQNVIADYGDWHVKFEQNYGATKVFTTAAKGNPFVFVDVSGTPATVVFNPNNEESQFKIVGKLNNALLFNMYPTGTTIKNGPKKGTRPEGFYAFYFPAGTLIASNDNVYKPISAWNADDVISPLKIKLPGAGTFSFSVMPDGSMRTLQIYEPHGYCKITDTRFTYQYEPKKARVTNNFSVTTTPLDGRTNVGTMQVLFRHQYLYSPEAKADTTKLSYWGPRGEAKVIAGNVFNNVMTYYGSVPELAKAAKRFNEAQIVNLVNGLFAFSQYDAYKTANYDDYNYFRSVAIWTQAAEIAHQINRPDLRDNLLDHAKMVIEDFLTSPTGDNIATGYSPEVNFMTTFPNSFNAYAGMYDYHFVVSYLIYACGMVAKFEQIRSGNLNWVNEYKPMVDLMVRNINDWQRDMSTPVGNTPRFPYLRYFDPYAGHSWFANYAEAQEAVSESVLFATGAMMWGDVTDNYPMRDMGAMLYVTESEAGRQYWFDYDDVGCIGGEFAPDFPSTHAGIVSEDGYNYATYYDPTQPNTAVAIHRASIMPITGSSLWLGTNVDAINRDMSSFMARQGSYDFTANTWSNEVLAYQALADAQAARAVYDKNVWSGQPPAMSLDQMLFPVIDEHWIATLDSVGHFDATVQGDIPFFSVFVKDTCGRKMRHYMMYNSPGTGPDHAQRTVNFTDGTCWDLPEDTLIVYKLLAPDTIKNITAVVGPCDSDPIDIHVDADLCPLMESSMYYQYSTDSVVWHTLYDVHTASDSLSVTYTPSGPGTYFFRIIMRSGKVPGLMCPMQDTSSVIAKVTVNSCCPMKVDSVSLTNITCGVAKNGKIIISASNGTLPYQYSVDNGITFVGTPVFTDLDTGVYYVVTKDASNCVVKRKVTLSGQQLLQISITKTDVTCANANDGSITAIVTGGVGTLSYSIDDVNYQSAATFIDLSAQSYTIFVKDNNACPASDTITVFEPEEITDSISFTSSTCSANDGSAAITVLSGGEAPYAFLWDARAANQNSATALNLGAGWYACTITDNKGCSKTDSVKVKNTGGVQITSSGQTEPSCFGKCDGVAMVVAQNGKRPYTYTWTSTASSDSTASGLCDGSYQVTVTDQNQCIDIMNFTLAAPDELQVTLLPFSTDVICVDGSVQMNGIVSGGTPPYSTKWNNDPSISNNNILNPVLIPLSKTKYTLTVKDKFNCEVSADLTLQPSPTVNILMDTLVDCEKIEASFSPLTNAEAPYEVKWVFDGVDSIAEMLPSRLFTSGNHSVNLVVNDASGCSASVSESLSFSMKNHPSAAFDYSPQQLSALDPTVYFTNLSVNAVSYKWTFGNNDSSTVSDPVYTYPDSGHYLVCLSAANEYNCVADTCRRIYVEGVSAFFVPNAFTPGSGGINEVFMPVISGLDPDGYELNIFNRWGELIFTSDNFNVGWDGVYHGKQVQADVYVWKITYREKDAKKKISKIGHVTVIK
ncbi:MAG: glycosyl hydrolase [Flavobacteriales bacterium]